MRASCAPCPVKALAGRPRAPWEEATVDVQNLESTAIKRAVVGFRGAREKDAITVVECLGVLQQDTMEGPLWKETLGRSLGSHDAAERVRGMYHGSGCRQETTRLYPAQRRDGVVLSTIKYLTRHLLDPFARAKPSLLLKTHGVFERASKQNGRLTILRIDIIAGALNVFSNYQSPFEKTLLTSGTTYI